MKWQAVLFAAANEMHEIMTMTTRSQERQGWRLPKELRTENRECRDDNVLRSEREQLQVLCHGSSDKRWHPSMMCMRCRLTLGEVRRAVRDKGAKEDGGIGGHQCDRKITKQERHDISFRGVKTRGKSQSQLESGNNV
jgi:hypothetical protein